jgi:glycosyltransferase involved in cell wall biosynthesis
MALKVSVIIPCYNEEATIRLVLESLLRQTYPLAQMEVVIADGMSTDRTRAEIAAFQEKHPALNLRIVDNPKRDIPAALNTAIAAAKGEIIVRLDAHALPYPEYVARSVQGVEEGWGANVGGVWEIQPGGDTWAAEAIAFAAAHPFGVGDAKYRYTDAAGEADTVPFGAFKKKLIEEIGAFDESLLTNEDYEFNVRVRKGGGKVWLDPSIRARYFARPSIGALANQYARYGYWKVRMLRRYPKSLRWRQAIPPLFVLSFLGMGVLSIWFPLSRWIWGGEVVLYALALLASGMQAVFEKRKITNIFGVPLAMMTMHFSWGGAFLWGLIARKTNDKADVSDS